MSIGEEDEKGNQLTIEAHELLRASDLQFVGNMEGSLLLEGGADVVVADGFTGNVALKTLEGTIRTLLDALRTELGLSVRWEARRGAHPPGARRLRKRLDPGDVRRRLPAWPQRPRCHRTRVELTRCVANAIRLGVRGVDHRVVERLQERLAEHRPQIAGRTDEP